MELVITLLVVGGLLVVAEIFLPGAIAGIIGVCCLIAGIVEGYLQFGARAGNGIVLGVIVGMIVGLGLWVRYFPDSRVGRVFVSQSASGDIGTEKPELVGQQGEALTPLRPAGAVMIQGKRVDVVTEGQLIERGSRVKVVAVEGMRVVVRAI